MDIVTVKPATKTSQENWDSYFLKMADLVASKSKDPSTKSGCVIVGPDNEIRSTGYNGFPRGVHDSRERYLDRPLKYQLVAHAEANAVFAAARMGVSLLGCRIYVNWHPCCQCAQAIIQSGICEVVIDQDGRAKAGGRWDESIKLADMMFEEAGVNVIWAEK